MPCQLSRTMHQILANKKRHRRLCTWVAALGLLPTHYALPSYGQEVIEEVLVTGQDYLSLLPKQKSSSAFGLDKIITQTPRSVTEVSSDLIEKFALRSVDDLVRLTPGAFTSSFVGIKGAMDIRGEPADNYYRGFRRIANPGAFNTNIRGAEKIEIMRGPASPLYGNSSIGGQMNYIPKTVKSTAAKQDGVVSGDIGFTVGSYKQRIAALNLSLPLTLNNQDGGMHVFAEIEDSESYYDVYEPSNELLQIAFNIDTSNRTTIELGGQYQYSDSIQVPGWNRVTQALIDDGTYITGAPQERNTGEDPSQLLPQESGFITSAAPVSINNAFSNVGRFCVPAERGGDFDAAATYNGKELACLGGSYLYPLSNVGTTYLEHSTTFIDDNDFADTTAITAYLDISHTFANNASWKTALFYDAMNHKKYQSWGFTAHYPNAQLWELRTRYNFELNTQHLSAKTLVGANYRHEDLTLKHAFLDETFDFRDISQGPTPNDRIAPAIDNPLANVHFGTDANGNTVIAEGTAYRNYNVHEVSQNKNAGLFALSDISLKRFNLLLGARYDQFQLQAEDIATTLLGNRFDSSHSAPGQQRARDNAFSYNGSLSYQFTSGFIPYITYAKSHAMTANQLGGAIPKTLASKAFLQDSSLFEAGIKYDGFDGRLYAALNYYNQDKSEQAGQTQALTEVFGQGYELELRAVASDALSIVATATHSETYEKGDKIFTVINAADFARQNGLAASDIYGGRIAGERGTFVGEGARLERGGLPNNIVSVFGTYQAPLNLPFLTPAPNNTGKLTTSLGFTWADKTASDVFGSVILPSYTAWTASLRYETQRVTTLLQINNLTNEKYYTSADLFDSVVVKPSEGRTLSCSFSYAF